MLNFHSATFWNWHVVKQVQSTSCLLEKIDGFQPPLKCLTYAYFFHYHSENEKVSSEMEASLVWDITLRKILISRLLIIIPLYCSFITLEVVQSDSRFLQLFIRYSICKFKYKKIETQLKKTVFYITDFSCNKVYEKI